MRAILALLSATCLAGYAVAAEQITLDTIVRAETDTAFRNGLDTYGVEVGDLFHVRRPTSIESQPVIRMNRDTLYSGVVLDLDNPAAITLPDTGGRYLSMHVINQDHYMYVVTQPGRHELTRESVGTRYAMVNFRIFVDASDPRDIRSANAVQDQIEVTGGRGPLELPQWDQLQLRIVRQHLNAIATMGFDAGRAFGRKDDVDPIHYIVGAIAGWGGLPRNAATYLLSAVENNDGTPYAVTVKDVPVDAFWSITVYNKDGFIQRNDRDAYSFNNVTAAKNADGSITIHFGHCDDGRVNCLPITDGWNYAVRLYQPRLPILDGSWSFPQIEQLN